MIRKIALLIGLVGVFQQALSQALKSSTSVGKYADVGGSKIWYEECGPSTPGPGVVLLHDGLLHSVTWDEVWKPLCSKYHVVRYDRRGYGRSDRARAPFVPEDDLLSILRIVHMDRTVIIGNSSGGGLAIDFTLAHPAMVSALFLIGPVVHGMANSDYFIKRGEENDAPLSHGDVRAAAERWSRDRFLIAGNESAARKKLYDVLADNPQNLKFGGELEKHPSPSAVSRLSEITVPTLILVGEADIGDVFAYAGAIKAAVPSASFEIWKDVGHLIQAQRPADMVTRFDLFYSLAMTKQSRAR